ncbi:annexin-2 receptor [Choloepus didactylus]|uniref:annexin-2 receptor n=1 Tax=Choloepus didactylus TaxID=27675 RepID=UPI0018A09D89|nr:annexin-2 receptor [Choloepus didactylus]
MEQHLLCCVHEAWDSAGNAPGPQPPPALSADDSGPGPLPFYPQLGQLSWDNQDFNWQLLSSPCGLLCWDCPRHRPGAQSTSERDTDPPTLDPTPATQREPEALAREADDAQETHMSSPRRPPSARLPRQGHTQLDPETLEGADPPQRRSPPAPAVPQGSWHRIPRAVAYSLRSFIRRRLLELRF